MKKTILASALCLSFTPVSHANEASELNGVVVTASRIPQQQQNVLADVSIIDRAEIERAGQATLVELLQRQPGIEISNTGGPGKTSGIFMRGTNLSHVVVLIDGIRISSATAGTTTFENLPLAQIDHIEILRGPSSSLYGQDAIGGVIQIFTKKGEGETRFNAAAGYGSYGTKTAEAGFSGQAGNTKYALNLSSTDIQGFSAYKTRNPRFKDDDGYRNLAFTANLTQTLVEGHEIDLQLFQSEGHTNFDSRFNSTNFSDNANLSQLGYAITARNQFAKRWLSTIKIGEGIDESENFQEFGRGLFKTKQRQYSWQNDVSLPLGVLTLLYDRLEQRVISTTSFDKDARDNDGFVASYVVNLDRHALQASYRSDHNSQFGTHDTGGISYGYNLDSNWRISGSYGTAFKAPTFNDLYFPSTPGFPPSSDPNLKSEKSRNMEMSLRYVAPATSGSITAYKNKIRDLILLDENFTPFNADDAEIKGLTIAGEHRWSDWELQGSIDIQSPRDSTTDNLLPRRAQRHSSLNLAHDWGNWRISGEVVASSKRYDDADNTEPLAGYSIFNLVADYTISEEWKLQTRVNNLFDKDYALAIDGNPNTTGFVYNTPGTNAFVGLRWQPK